MSLLSKLTVGAMAVLGAYALKGKRQGKRRKAGAPAEDKPAAGRGKTAKAAPKAAATPRRSKARSAKRAAPRKRAPGSATRRTS